MLAVITLFLGEDMLLPATNLLHDLGRSSEEHTTEVLCLAVGEESLVWRRLGKATGSANAVHDNVPLDGRLRRVQLITPKRGDDDFSLLVTLVGQEPTGRLGQEPHGNGNDEGEDDLEGDGESPGKLGWAVRCSIVDPVCHTGAEGDDTTLDTDKKSTVRSLTALGLVGRNCRGIYPIANTHHYSANDELCEWRSVVLRSDLDDDTAEHDYAAEDNGTPSPEQVAHTENEHGSHQASYLVNSGHKALHGRVVPGGHKQVVEGRCGDDAAHDTVEA